jgi:two-component system sensor histidine kinase DesK
MRLLPNDKDIGWVPYVWLVYLVSLPINGYFWRLAPLEWAATFMSIAVFLMLYFRAYWVDGRDLLWTITLIAAIGVAIVPIVPAAAVYFIYAGSFAGKMERPATAVRILGTILAVLIAETAILKGPFYFAAYFAAFILAVGVVNIYYGQQHRARKKLAQAQEEIERLAQIAERDRIARDLHDVLGHTLSVIVLKSELASKLADADPARAVQEIKHVERISRHALAQVRATVQGYQARSLEAEAKQAAAALEAAGVKVRFDFASANIPPAHEGVLALALREAVTNVIRHAKASSCTLSLHLIPGGCQLEVRDDGCGQLSPEGTGLSGMRKRVEALGGKLQREASAGTRILITLPEASR